MQRINNDSNDHMYFTITQRLVWALARDPFDLTLWQVIKDIAGDKGECTISTPDLAILAMMSTGKVSESRSYLMGAGLLTGELKRDPDYPQPVWHLAIPDLWADNITWSQNNTKITDRIAFKIDQREFLKELSPHETRGKELSPHEKGLSPHEKGLVVRERGLSPHETKKIVNKTSKNKKNNGAGGVKSAQDAMRKLAEDTFIEITKLQPIGNTNALGTRWYGPLREICQLCEWQENTIKEVIAGGIKLMQGKNLDIIAPQSILGYCNRFRANLKGIQPHGANGSSLTPPASLPKDFLDIWKTIPLDLQRYIIQNPTKLTNFKAALVSKGLY